MKHIKWILGIICVVTAVTFLVISIKEYKEEDTEAPVISSTSDEITVSSSASEEELLAGLTAQDDRDGDLTDKIRIGDHSRFESSGICNIEYLVFDNGYNAGEYTRRIIYEDYVSPVFSLNMPLQYQTNDTISVLDRLQVTDCLEGDISGKMRILSGNVDSTEEGIYVVTVEVSNSYGDSVSLNLPLHIQQTLLNVPTITLSTYLIYQKVGETPDLGQYLIGANNLDGSPIDLSQIQIISSVNTSEPGVYDVTYQYTDMNNRTGYTYLIVVVTE